MNNELEVRQNSEVGIQPNAGRSNLGAKYKRARLKNQATGQRLEIILADPHSLDNSLRYDPQHELKADVHKVLESFSPIERRIILRVLVQGQSLEQATCRMKSSSQKWRQWFATTAIPRLRKQLKDYFQDGKLVLE